MKIAWRYNIYIDYFYLIYLFIILETTMLFQATLNKTIEARIL